MHSKWNILDQIWRTFGFIIMRMFPNNMYYLALFLIITDSVVVISAYKYQHFTTEGSRLSPPIIVASIIDRNHVVVTDDVWNIKYNSADNL